MRKARINKARYDTKRKEEILEKGNPSFMIKLIEVNELKELREMWMKIHPKHPSKDIGLGIIDEFLSLSINTMFHQSYIKWNRLPQPNLLWKMSSMMKLSIMPSPWRRMRMWI
jgi:hypothetical protein